jgi:hypothetical protein
MAKAMGLVHFDYVLKRDRGLPPEELTVWHLKSLTWSERETLGYLHLESDDSGRVTMLSNSIEKARRALNCGLVGWTNFLLPDGTPAVFKLTGGDMRRISNETLDLIQTEDALELANAIIEGSAVGESLSKNS